MMVEKYITAIVIGIIFVLGLGLLCAILYSAFKNKKPNVHEILKQIATKNGGLTRSVFPGRSMAEFSSPLGLVLVGHWFATEPGIDQVTPRLHIRLKLAEALAAPEFWVKTRQSGLSQILGFEEVQTQDQNFDAQWQLWARPNMPVDKLNSLVRQIFPHLEILRQKTTRLEVAHHNQAVAFRCTVPIEDITSIETSLEMFKVLVKGLAGTY